MEGTGEGNSVGTEWEGAFQRLLGRQGPHQGTIGAQEQHTLTHTQDIMPVVTWSEGWIARDERQHGQGVVRKEPRVEI